MPTEQEQIALLERQVAELRARLGAAGRRQPERPRSRTRRGLTVAGLVLALAVLPAIAVASHSFSDVPDDHTFHLHIEAVKDAGVTSGCTATKYCPEAFVTRGQMAAFLNRLGALAPGMTPVVNADRVDGLDSTALAQTNVVRQIGPSNGVGNNAGCHGEEVSVVIVDGSDAPVDARFTFQVPGPNETYGQIRADGSIRTGSANLAGVTHVAGSGIYCLQFAVVPDNAARESAVMNVHGE